VTSEGGEHQSVEHVRTQDFGHTRHCARTLKMGFQSFVQSCRNSCHLPFELRRLISFLFKGKKMSNIRDKRVAHLRVYKFGEMATAILDRWRATFF